MTRHRRGHTALELTIGLIVAAVLFALTAVNGLAAIENAKAAGDQLEQPVVGADETPQPGQVCIGP